MSIFWWFVCSVYIAIVFLILSAYLWFLRESKIKRRNSSAKRPQNQDSEKDIKKEKSSTKHKSESEPDQTDESASATVSTMISKTSQAIHDGEDYKKAISSELSDALVEKVLQKSSILKSWKDNAAVSFAIRQVQQLVISPFIEEVLDVLLNQEIATMTVNADDANNVEEFIVSFLKPVLHEATLKYLERKIPSFIAALIAPTIEQVVEQQIREALKEATATPTKKVIKKRINERGEEETVEDEEVVVKEGSTEQLQDKLNRSFPELTRKLRLLLSHSGNKKATTLLQLTSSVLSEEFLLNVSTFLGKELNFNETEVKGLHRYLISSFRAQMNNNNNISLSESQTKVPPPDEVPPPIELLETISRKVRETVKSEIEKNLHKVPLFIRPITAYLNECLLEQPDRDEAAQQRKNAEESLRRNIEALSQLRSSTKGTKEQKKPRDPHLSRKIIKEVYNLKGQQYELVMEDLPDGIQVATLITKLLRSLAQADLKKHVSLSDSHNTPGDNSDIKIGLASDFAKALTPKTSKSTTKTYEEDIEASELKEEEEQELDEKLLLWIITSMLTSEKLEGLHNELNDFADISDTTVLILRVMHAFIINLMDSIAFNTETLLKALKVLINRSLEDYSSYTLTFLFRVLREINQEANWEKFSDSLKGHFKRSIFLLSFFSSSDRQDEVNLRKCLSHPDKGYLYIRDVLLLASKYITSYLKLLVKEMEAKTVNKTLIASASPVVADVEADSAEQTATPTGTLAPALEPKPSAPGTLLNDHKNAKTTNIRDKTTAAQNKRDFSTPKCDSDDSRQRLILALKKFLEVLEVSTDKIQKLSIWNDLEDPQAEGGDHDKDKEDGEKKQKNRKESKETDKNQHAEKKEKVVCVEGSSPQGGGADCHEVKETDTEQEQKKRKESKNEVEIVVELLSQFATDLVFSGFFSQLILQPEDLVALLSMIEESFTPNRGRKDSDAPTVASVFNEIDKANDSLHPSLFEEKPSRDRQPILSPATPISNVADEKIEIAESEKDQSPPPSIYLYLKCFMENIVMEIKEQFDTKTFGDNVQHLNFENLFQFFSHASKKLLSVAKVMDALRSTDTFSLGVCGRFLIPNEQDKKYLTGRLKKSMGKVVDVTFELSEKCTKMDSFVRSLKEYLENDKVFKLALKELLMELLNMDELTPSSPSALPSAAMMLLPQPPADSAEPLVIPADSPNLAVPAPSPRMRNSSTPTIVVNTGGGVTKSFSLSTSPPPTPTSNENVHPLQKSDVEASSSSTSSSSSAAVESSSQHTNSSPNSSTTLVSTVPAPPPPPNTRSENPVFRKKLFLAHIKTLFYSFFLEDRREDTWKHTIAIANVGKWHDLVGLVDHLLRSQGSRITHALRDFLIPLGYVMVCPGLKPESMKRVGTKIAFIVLRLQHSTKFQFAFAAKGGLLHALPSLPATSPYPSASFSTFPSSPQSFDTFAPFPRASPPFMPFASPLSAIPPSEFTSSNSSSFSSLRVAQVEDNKDLQTRVLAILKMRQLVLELGEKYYTRKSVERDAKLGDQAGASTLLQAEIRKQGRHTHDISISKMSARGGGVFTDEEVDLIMYTLPNELKKLSFEAEINKLDTLWNTLKNEEKKVMWISVVNEEEEETQKLKEKEEEEKADEAGVCQDDLQSPSPSQAHLPSAPDHHAATPPTTHLPSSISRPPSSSARSMPIKKAKLRERVLLGEAPLSPRELVQFQESSVDPLFSEVTTIAPRRTLSTKVPGASVLSCEEERTRYEVRGVIDKYYEELFMMRAAEVLSTCDISPRISRLQAILKKLSQIVS